MPHPGLFTEMEVLSEKALYTEKQDIDNHYHRLSLPGHLRSFFGLHPVKIGGGQL